MRPALSTSISILLVASLATIGLKSALTNYNAIEDTPRLDRDIVALLRQSGFAVTARRESQRPPTFYGDANGCRIMLRHATDPGSFSYSYRQRALGIGPVHYRIGAADYADVPTIRLWMDDLLAKTWRSIGLGAARPAPIVIATGAGCASAPDTGKLRLYPMAARR